MLKIKDVWSAFGHPSLVKFDHYVPLTFRSSDKPLPGARYIQIGGAKTQIFDLQFPADSMKLSGFTLVSFSGGTSLHAPLVGGGPSVMGLPIFEIPEGKNFCGQMPRIHLKLHFGILSMNRSLEISFGNLNTFNEIIEYGKVQFLLMNGNFVGIRILNMSNEDAQIFSQYAYEHNK